MSPSHRTSSIVGRLAERNAPPQSARDVRRLRHRLGAADEADVGVAEDDLLRAADDRLEAGAAETVERQRRSFLPATRFERDVPGEINRIAGRVEDVSEDRLIDVGRPRFPRARWRSSRRGRRDRSERRPSAFRRKCRTASELLREKRSPVDLSDVMLIDSSARSWPFLPQFTQNFQTGSSSAPHPAQCLAARFWPQWGQ